MVISNKGVEREHYGATILGGMLYFIAMGSLVILLAIKGWL